MIQIDLAQGQITSRAKSRSGEVPGNLICHRGEVISQGSNCVEAFYQIDLLKQRDRPEAWPDRPTIRNRSPGWAKSSSTKATCNKSIDLFRRSFDLAPNDHTRGLLVSSLLEGLRRDFAGTRGKAAELEKLIDQQADRNVYLRLDGRRTETVGRIAGRLRCLCLPVERTDDRPTRPRSALEPAGEGLRVRRQRWIQSELGDLRAHASPADVEQIDQRVAARLQSAIDADSIAALRAVFGSFWHASAGGRGPRAAGRAAAGHRRRCWNASCFCGGWHSRPTRVRRARRWPGWPLCSTKPRRPDLSIYYYRQLRDQWADIPCLDGKTGAELIAALPPDAPVRKLIAGSRPPGP